MRCVGGAFCTACFMRRARCTMHASACAADVAARGRGMHAACLAAVQGRETQAAGY